MSAARLIVPVCPILVLVLGTVPGQAQQRTAPAGKPANSAAVRVLDKEAEKLQQEFVDSLEKLADGYEAAGDVEKAKLTLGRVLELDPQRDAVREHLDELQNRVFDENEAEVQVDVTRGWVSTGLKVHKGQAVRVAGEGSYKLILNTTVSPDGVDTEDLNRDMASGIKLGALMGVVIPPPQGRQKPKPGKPFQIGAQAEISPEESGLLFLRLNVPSGTKSVGGVKVTVSGHFER